jgi:hypothetical protein
MILETLDVKRNDIFIYSLNQFDFHTNFKLINKDTQVKYPKAIHYNDVCRYVQDGRPKNLIVYRLLTNIPNLDPNYLKYSLTINLDRAKEALYFDPVFAIKELEELKDIELYPQLRFRIQQVGLISVLSRFGQPYFQEVYSFDLQVPEVRAQNDKVFAEIIFAFDEIHFDEDDPAARNVSERQIKSRKFVTMTPEIIRPDEIEEDPHTNAMAIRKMPSAPSKTAESIAREIEEEMNRKKEAEEKTEPEPVPSPAPLPSPAPAPFKEELKLQLSAAKGRQAKDKPTFGDFLTKVKRNMQEEETPVEKRHKAQGMTNIFKTNAHITDFVNERGKKQVVLKLRR